MQRSINLALALAAGLVGGVLSRYTNPVTVFAQAQTQVSKDIRAQSFTLTDENGNVVGIFTSVAPRGGQKRAVILLDQNANEIWSAGASPIRPLVSQR